MLLLLSWDNVEKRCEERRAWRLRNPFDVINGLPTSFLII